MNNYEDNNYNYNNDETNVNKKPLSHYIKKFLIAFLFIVIAMFLLLWLFPTKSALNPFYDRIFNDNLNTMKEVATAYYTTERLPKNVGDTKKLTLKEMLEMKLLLEIKDKNGDMCDVNNSYVELTKLDNEYKMKVNLKCGDEEDYIIVYMGCYDYCLNDICEKQDKTKTKSQTKITKKPKYYCAVVNGKYYDDKGKKVSKASYEKACKPKPTKHYCAVVNGKYYDNKGKVVSKSAYEKACKSKPTKHYCAVVNGKYYDNKGNVVSKSTYEKACNIKPTKYYCAVVNGKYYDDKGNVVSKTAYEKACTTPEPVYKYLYQKEVSVKYDKEYSNWSDWSGNIEYNPNTDNINWGKHEYVWYEKTAPETKTTTKLVTDRTKPIYQTKTVKMGSYTRWVCSSYEYFINKTTNTLYQTNGWTYRGIVELSYIPSDTNTTQYLWVDMYYENCGQDVCNVNPVYRFKKYTRSATKVTKTKEELEAVCNVESRNIDVYATVYDEFVAYEKKQVKETQTKYYYHKKTRTLIKDAYTDTKVYKLWSYDKNDKSLIDQGYRYTGIYKRVN